MKNKILKIIGSVLLVLIAFVWTAPYLFKGKIIRIVKSRVHKDLKAHVNFSDVDISWFRHFPKISVGLNNLQLVCAGDFDGDTLIAAKQFDIACNVVSFFSGDSIKIYSITASEPRVHMLIRKDGHRNWDILKTATASTDNTEQSTKAIKLELQRYAIHNGYVYYQDESKNIHIEITNLEHEGKGNFNSDLFTLRTKTTADAINFNVDGAIPYRVTAKTNMDLVFEVENKTHTWSFKTDQVSFNDLKLHTEGFFQWINDSSYNMDIKFNAPSNEFKNILSMLPSVYQKDFASIKSGGHAIFNGFVKGKYDEKHNPAYHINLDVKNGFFQYPDLPMPVENINLSLDVDNADGIADHMIVDIPQAHVEINNDPLDLRLSIKNPKTKPVIDLALVGKLDLANISKLIKLEPGTHLAGLLNSDIRAEGIVPGTDKLKKDPFHATGSFDVRDFSYTSKNYPGGIILNGGLLTFNSKNVLINELKGEYLATHVNVTGALNNLFAFAIENKPLNALIDLKVDEINLRDWMRTAKDPSSIGASHNNGTFIVPDNIDFTINAEADKLHYDNLDMQHVSGKVQISDETIQLAHIKADALDGTISMNGTYSTWQSREYPEIAFNYDVNGLDVQKTFFAFNTLQKLMPVAKFISGKFNAQLNLNGRLGNEMIPELQSLHGDGNLLLTDGLMKDFGPLDKVSQSLDIAEMKDVPLKDTKADFTFKSGKVTLTPFVAHTNDIEMEIAGTHGFDQSLDYTINLKVPRSKLGSKGNTFVKNVVEQAADKGIPVKLKDAVSMNVKMIGTINTPDVKTDMNAVVDNAATDLKKEVNDFVNAKLDSAKQQLRNPSASAKKQMAVQTSYKAKNNLKTKNISKSANKKTGNTKSKNKQKPTRKYYSTSSKKDKSTASNSRKQH